MIFERLVEVGTAGVALQGGVDLVLPDALPPRAAGFPWAPATAVVAAVGLIGVALWLWKVTPAPDPGEVAFRRVARAMGLSRAQRRLARALAEAHGSASPVAILLSAEARRRAASAATIDDQAVAARDGRICGLGNGPVGRACAPAR
jgi:hypothetical protein